MDEKNRKEYQTVVLAALLHDVGKFAERAGMEISSQYEIDNAGLYQPYKRQQNRHTHRHALYTAAFIERFSRLLPTLDDSNVARSGNSLINLAAMHHKPETPLQWIITVADRLSSGLDRQDFEGEAAGVAYRDFRKTRLIPISEELSRGIEFYKNDTLETYQYRYRLREQSPEQVFPVPKAEADSPNDASAMEEYATLFATFTNGLNALDHRDYPTLWMGHFTSLWKRFASCIPAATVGKVIPDVSLYDHCRATAALAGALYRYHTETGTLQESAIINNKPDKFILVSGDFYGIQKFIFSEGGSTNKAAAKLFRGRSFAVSLLSELASDQLCHALGLSETSVLLDAAGKFTIIAPNLPGTIAEIKRVEQELNEWMIKHFYGETTIGLSWVAASGNNLEMEHFPNLYKRLFEMSNEKKYRKFDLDTHAGVVGSYLDSFDNTQSSLLCSFCGKRAANRETRGDHLIGEEEASCFVCRDHIWIGARLIKSKTLAVFNAPNETAGNGNNLKDPLFGRYQIAFDLEERTIQRSAEVGSLIRINHLAKAGEPLTPSMAVRFLGGYVPVYSREDEHDNSLLRDKKSDEIKADGIKAFHHIAKAARNTQNGSDKDTGVEALGILKADVDNLGKLFACGLPKERLNLSRLATLSRQMNDFFSIYLPNLCATDPRFSNLYTVFAGGDDLFLIGPWNRVIDFSEVLQKSFNRFACENAEITISVGISVNKPGMPVPAIARQAEKALKASKDAGRNRLTMFDETVTWAEFGQLLIIRDTLEDWQRRGYLGTAMLYRMNELMSMAREEENIRTSKQPVDLRNMDCLAWRSRFTYSATRNVGKALDKNARKQALEEVMNAVTWLHDYEGKLKIALWQVLYNQR